MARPAVELYTLSSAAKVARALPPATRDERLPASVAQDLRGTVTIIQAFAQLLPELEGERQREATRKIVRACKQLVELLERALASETVAFERRRVGSPSTSSVRLPLASDLEDPIPLPISTGS